MTDETLRARKKRETRHRIHLAALRLVADRGLGALTVDDIAAAADVSPRTFFNYFPTKDAAVVGLPPDLGDQLVGAFLARPADEPCPEGLRVVLADVLTDGAHSDDAGSREAWLEKKKLLTEHPELSVALAGATRAAQERLVHAVADRYGLEVDESPYPRLVVGVAFAALAAAMARRRHQGPGGGDLRQDLDEVYALLAAGLPDPAHAAA